MKNFLGAIVVMLMVHQSQAQKVVKKSIVSQSISLISIDASNCFEIYLDTHDADEMNVTAKIEGEYQNDLQVSVQKNGRTINVDAGFNHDFINPNDKLSAHKVVSIALRILLPKNSKVQLYGNDCNLHVHGVYDELNITLNDGWCELNTMSEKATIQTQSGNITLNAIDAAVEAKSKFGSVKGDSFQTGSNHYILSTVTGNIVLKRVE